MMIMKSWKKILAAALIVVSLAISASAYHGPYQRPFSVSDSLQDYEIRDADGDLVFDPYSTTSIPELAYNNYMFGPGMNSFFPDNYATNPRGTCAISTGHGLLDDLDCDGIPDFEDNCPQAPNPRQADQNRNGIGDACDLSVQKMNVQPKKLSCGRALVANAQALNNRGVPFNDVKATLKIPGLNVEQVEYIKVMQPGSAKQLELTSRIPVTAGPGSYNLIVELEYNVAGRLQKTATAQKIDVAQGMCKEPSKDSFVDVKEIQDVKPGEKAVFPIKIENTEQRANSYTFDVKDVSDFGTYSINPGSLVIIEGESEETVYLNVMADDEAEEGSKTFVFEIRKGDEVEQVVLVANVLPEDEDNAALGWLVGGFAAIILLFVALGYVARNKDWFEVLNLNTRGEKKTSLGQKSIVEYDSSKSDREKVAKTGIKRQKGWLYYVDKQGDVSRSKMAWAKG